MRSEINSWLASRKVDELECLNIGAVAAADVVAKESGETQQELSRYEKRLVHQLVRAEYLDLVTISKRGFIQIIRFNKEREDRLAADRKRDLHERIGRQKGFRWIIEAMHGSDITNLDLRQCARDPATGEHVFADMDEYKAQFYRAVGLLRRNPRVLVGHNCFLDLVYVYRTFIGDLPDTVEEFQAKIHHIWPMIIDTKYMSTHNCGDINPVSSLEQIAQQLSAQEKPTLEIDKEHKKYEGVEALHEAGYDGFLTAQIAVRLSSKLEKEGAYVEANGITNGHDAKEIGDRIGNMKLTETALDSHTYHVANSTSPPSDVDSFMPSIEGAGWKRKGDPTLPPTARDDPFEYNPKDLKHHHYNDQSEKTFEGGMPSFISDFWRIYGNKLRVFGTEESVCILDGLLSDAEDDGGVGQGGVEV